MRLKKLQTSLTKSVYGSNAVVLEEEKLVVKHVKITKIKRKKKKSIKVSK